MKKVLIISPYFPPVNAADMHRVRMSMAYFVENGWEAEVVMVDEQSVEMPLDDLLRQSLPSFATLHKVPALPRQWTAKAGLGSISLRSLWFYRRRVDRLLISKMYDLIYFSTTQFPVCILGRYWKIRFHVPYVIDMQDPWHSDYYRDKPPNERPPKYWFSYRLNKYLEPLAMRSVDGLISVSEQYIIDLKRRYPSIATIPAAVIPFGGLESDFGISRQLAVLPAELLDKHAVNMVYIGRGGTDMYPAITPLFEALNTALSENPELFGRLRLYFIGTSYAPRGQGKPTILPLAEKYGLQNQVTEITDRMGYYQTLSVLQSADALFIPGSDDPRYSASKIFSYLLSKRPLLAIFHQKSPALDLLQEFGVKYIFDYQTVPVPALLDFLRQLAAGGLSEASYEPEALRKYSAAQLTREQCALFDKVLNQ